MKKESFEDSFIEVPEPKFRIGQTVRIKDNNSAIIVLNEWHNEKNQHYYIVKVNNKRKSKRYFESELMDYN